MQLADGQFLTALAWGIDFLQDADDPPAHAKEQGCSPRQTQDKTWPLLRSGRLSAADWNGPFSRPKFRTRILESRH
jgi:hypothetical protein